MEISVAAISSPGLRKINQDYTAYSVRGGAACLVACDGLGAYDGSEIASRLVARAFVDMFDSLIDEKNGNLATSDSVMRCCSAADAALAGEKSKHPDLTRICTTIAAVIIDGPAAVFCHIGDSRVYHFKKDGNVRVTSDHSMAQQAVDCGEITRQQLSVHPGQNKLTRVLGGKNQPVADVSIITDVEPGDSFLVCTDGLWSALSEDEMFSALYLPGDAAVSLGIIERVVISHMRPKHDNYSAVAAKICGEP